MVLFGIPAHWAPRPKMTPGSARRKAEPWTDPSPHVSLSAKVNGVRLNYLDWGGSGPNLIFIPGLFDNAHCFDALAPAFLDRYRAVAYSRRGHGRSQAKSPYDPRTWVEDLRCLMDKLGMGRAHLAGWSAGGIEVTGMAVNHPTRVDRIVYLDAALDFDDPKWKAIGQSYVAAHPVEARRLSSLDAWWEYWDEKFPGRIHHREYEASIRDGVIVHRDGSVRPRTSDRVAGKLWSAAMGYRKDYSAVRVPALAICPETFLDVANGSAAVRADHRAWERKIAPWREGSRRRLQRELKGAKIVAVSGSHGDFFVKSQKQVAAAMRRFLDG